MDVTVFYNSPLPSTWNVSVPISTSELLVLRRNCRLIESMLKCRVIFSSVSAANTAGLECRPMLPRVVIFADGRS